ncbi:MAG: MFS transporter [Rhodospirillaceae bacterium]|nr:MFS transporter [Rhodospirillaceae bacterium]MBT3808826.1 MFS transporter [Rhodospirillaceae bacterium]MBT4772455.1 MFS transporter [Rhodospirillaceae bacterium]MBT5358951.1 MFS transporter [Rhodospirillaceae bacterium]MBT5769637.1 MFS transporter [Rhodospirillaceae bacterium]
MRAGRSGRETTLVDRENVHFLLLNIGHFLTHLFMLIFATAAALTLSRDWGMSYGELIAFATPGFVAYAVFTLPAGWLADRWSREGMMAVFFVGIGAASAVTALAETPVQMAVGLFAIGMFAAIYHPVGIALVIHGRQRTGVPIAINGIFGNLGVAAAALITALFIDHAGWRSAFVWPGLFSMVIGGVYLFVVAGRSHEGHQKARPASAGGAGQMLFDRATMIRVLVIVFLTSSMGGLVFQSTTFTLPKVFDEQLGDIAVTASDVGWFAFLVLAIAAVGQLIVGYLVDRVPVRRVFMIVAALQASLFAIMPGLTGWQALIVAIAFMFAVFGQIPINDVLIGRVTHTEWRSRVFALRYMINFSIIASSVPLIAWIHSSWGFDTLFVLLAVTAACIFAAVSLLPVLRFAATPAE